MEGLNQTILDPVSKVSVGYLPPITAPPTEMNVIYCVIERSLHIQEELGIEGMFLEVDQAIYAQPLDAMFKMEAEGKNVLRKIFARMCGFHILLCLSRGNHEVKNSLPMFTWQIVN